MALIALAIYDTEENKRTEITRLCFDSLVESVRPTDRVYLIDNNCSWETKRLINKTATLHGWKVITNQVNLGTAEAINLAWKFREPGEHCMKIDNDVVWHQKDWIPLMEECITRDPNIGIIGLKRKDCCETTWHEDPQYRSELKMLPHVPGERWLIVEKVHHVMGTCQLYNSALLDKIGFLFQPGLYGFDDVLASYRSQVAGFYNAHFSFIDIDHIDLGGTDYQTWKERIAGGQFPLVHKIVCEYLSGEKSIYHNPFNE